jgi:hypothetical protein
MGIFRAGKLSPGGIIITLGIIMSFIGCAKKESGELLDYPGWQKYTYRHFVFNFPEGSYWGRNIDRFANAYERYLIEDCEFMAIELPTDTIHFYIHESPEKGAELTGRELPFHTENQIHWGRQSPFGLELARFLIDKMGIRKTDFDFLYAGLATLRDYSGRNFHHNTILYVEAGQYIRLDTLIDNDSFARAYFRRAEAEAASLVAFITYNWGINRFKMLWQSAATFEESVKELFDMDLETFEDMWLQFARLHSEKVPGETVPEDDTTVKE